MNTSTKFHDVYLITLSARSWNKEREPFSDQKQLTWIQSNNSKNDQLGFLIRVSLHKQVWTYLYSRNPKLLICTETDPHGSQVWHMPHPILSHEV